MSVRIFGVGNTLLCDDGVGVEVSRLINIPTGGFAYQGEIFVGDCISEIEEGDMVIIIDAIMLGKKPGDVISLTFNQCEKYFPPQAFCHDASLLYSILYSNIKVTGYLIGIQIARIDYKEGLSEVISSKLGEIVDKVNSEVKKICMK